jgi:hypothetical protein
MQSSPASCHFLSLSSKYSPQHSIVKHRQCSSLSMRHQVPHHYKKVKLCFVNCDLQVFREENDSELNASPHPPTILPYNPFWYYLPIYA